MHEIKLNTVICTINTVNLRHLLSEIKSLYQILRDIKRPKELISKHFKKTLQNL